MKIIQHNLLSLKWIIYYLFEAISGAKKKSRLHFHTIQYPLFISPQRDDWPEGGVEEGCPEAPVLKGLE